MVVLRFGGGRIGPLCATPGGNAATAPSRERPQLLDVCDEAPHHRPGIRDALRIGHHTDGHFARVTEDGHAHGHAPGHGRPHEDAPDRGARQVHGLARARDVGDHGGAHPAEDVEQGGLDLPGRGSHRAEDGVGDRPLGRALDRVHPFAHRRQPLQRVLEADGQRERHEPETVAQVTGQRLVRGPKVERDGGADLVDEAAPADQVVAQRARQRGDEHVVYRRAVVVRHRLDVRQGNGLGPGHALGHTQRAAQDGRGVGRGEQHLGEGARPVAGRPGEVDEVPRVRHDLHVLVDRPTDHRPRGMHGRRGGARHGPERPAAPGGRGRRVGDRARAVVLGGVGEGQEHTGQGDPVADGVVDAGQHRPPHTVDEVELRAASGQRTIVRSAT